MPRYITSMLILLCLLPRIAQVFASPDHRHDHDTGSTATHEGEHRVSMSAAAQHKANITTAVAGSAKGTETRSLFGKIAIVPDRGQVVYSPYPSSVKAVHVRLGDKVRKDQKLLTLMNTETLQVYTLVSPLAGEVTFRDVFQGEKVDSKKLLQIDDLSIVYAELHAFPNVLADIHLNQPVNITDIESNQSTSGLIGYIGKSTSADLVTRIRSKIDNASQYWRVGMPIKARVVVKEKLLRVAVPHKALQYINEKPVVFVQEDGEFEMREVITGITTAEGFTEIIDGLAPGERYVVGNSFVVKSQMLKSTAEHSH